MNINYNELLKAELNGVYGDFLEKVNKVNQYYSIYDGEQGWDTAQNLDYTPTKKITNLIKQVIDRRARFMFGIEPYFNINQVKKDEKGSTTHRDKAQAKEDLLYIIFNENKFHSKLLKAKKDCSIGGKIAIKLWAHKDKGLKIVFSPAQEFFTQFNIDNVDELEKIVFLYALNNENEAKNQRIKKQVWELVNNKCILNESTYDGKGTEISVEYKDHDTGLDFIPVIIIINGGLTGETDGKSDVEGLWPNQDSYNRLTSDDIDALKFQMFGQDVVTDADENSLRNIKISPGAMIDLQTDLAQSSEKRQAKMDRLESKFSYKDKFEDTINRIKNDLYDTLDVPNISLEQLKGLMQSGKSMKALYWSLKVACDEDWTEWGPNLKQMAEYIFKMVEVYNLYEAKEIAKYETTLNIERYFPIQDDEDTQKQVDMEEVTTEVRSRRSYMKKWGDYQDIEGELEQIQLEKQMFEDSYTRSLNNNLDEE